MQSRYYISSLAGSAEQLLGAARSHWSIENSLGTGLGRWGRTRRRAVDHRPGLHHLRDLRIGQGGGPPPRLHRPAGLSPAAGRGCRHRRRADGTAAGGPRQHRSGRRPLFARDGGADALRGSQRTAHRAGRQRLLHSFHRRGLPQAGCPLLHHHPPARPVAEPHRGHTRGGLDAHPLLDGRCRRCGGDHLHPLSKRARRRAGGGSSSGG